MFPPRDDDARANAAFDTKHRSRALTEGPARAAARAYLYGIGFDEDALKKPIIGVASTWIETMPCNFHLRALAAKVKEGIRAAGGTPMELNTIAISDGITMGTSGMKTSLVSREVIADSIELVALGHLFDGVVAISGCDKTIPGTVMALARLNIPGVMLYGGSIAPGRYKGQDVTIQDVFEAVGKHAAGTMTDEELDELEHVASPGAGACGGQFTANTMAMAFEVLGISPMGSAMVPAVHANKAEVAVEAGKLVMDVLERGLQAARHHHEGLARERDRRDRHERRLDQRRPAPARGRAAKPASSSTSTTSTASPSRRRCCATSSPAASTSPTTSTPPAACRSSRSACSRPACCTRTRSPSPAAPSASTPARPPRPRASRSSGRSTTRSRRPAASRSCAATSRPRAAS